jgi:hypothetical protein
VADSERQIVSAGGEVDLLSSTTAGHNDQEAVRLLARIAELEAEIAQLKDGMASRQQIGLITGVLAERLDLTPKRAWSVVVRLSTQTNLKAREVARVLYAGYFGQLSHDDLPLAARLNEQLPSTCRIDLAGDRATAETDRTG